MHRVPVMESVLGQLDHALRTLDHRTRLKRAPVMGSIPGPLAPGSGTSRSHNASLRVPMMQRGP